MPRRHEQETRVGMRPAPSRRTLFALTLLAPFAVIAILEFALRIAGIGQIDPLFVPVEGEPGYVQPNPDVIRRFFPDPDAAPTVSIDSIWFRPEKPDGTKRIFVLGESSAAGFPYGRWASPGEFLARRLRDSVPDGDVEVISTAMAAVTSYVLLDFVDEILARDPDAIVIYTGHNEYLGIGGVGSSYVSAGSPSLARLTMTLRRLHVYRALETTLSGLLGSRPPGGDGTLMARTARERRIESGSALYEQGLAQFRGNMRRILERFSAAGVPVFVGTLASNERDQAPFLNVLEESTPVDSWNAAVERGRTALAAGEADTAETAFREAVALDGGAAQGWFQLGGALEAEGRLSEAREAYLAAKDRDALRFRAPEAMNAILRELAPETGAVLVDSQRALAAASKHHIIGNDLMLEHLHPNVRGYFLLADAFYKPVATALGATADVSRETAWEARPVTEIDTLAGGYRLEVLRHDWPFVPERRAFTLPPPAGDIERLAQAWFLKQRSWADTMNEALGVYQRRGDATEAARVAVNIAEAFVATADAQAAAGRLLIRAGTPRRAVRYLARAVTLEPGDIDYGLSLAQAQYGSGDADASAATLERLIRLAPDDTRPARWLNVVRAPR